MNSNNTGAIVGKCIMMCPTNERILRMRERLVHPLECKVDLHGVRSKFPDHLRMVKEFKRSAAGHIINAGDVRPLPVLQKTVNYLLSDICLSKCANWKDRYEFVADRLRAVRQDITVQDLTGYPVAKVYHCIARFYVFAAYNMCEYDEKQYDSYQNMKQLNEVISIILNIYQANSYSFGDSILDDRIAATATALAAPNGDSEEQMAELADMLADVDLNPNADQSLLSDDLVDMQFNRSVLIDDYKYYRVEEIVALNLLVNLGSKDALRDATQLPKSLRRGHLLASVMSACLWWLHGNFVPLQRLVADLPLILCCALHLNLGQIQRRALGMFSVSHDKTNFCDKSDCLRKHLLFSSPKKLIDTCSYYGLDSSPDGIKFQKSSFNWDAVPMKTQKSEWLNVKLEECSLPSLLLH